jgi:FO synthase
MTEASALLGEFEREPLPGLLARARASAKSAHGAVVTWSPKVFIPLTRLCQDSCGYCTFARGPRQVPAPFLSIPDVLAIAHAGASAGCREALFTLGDRPEARYAVARDALASLGFKSTVDYLVQACERVLAETALLPHVNAGLLTDEEMRALRRVSVSQGLMLESASQRLCERGGPHQGCTTKHPAARLDMIERAGRLAIPFTSGILVGIGETRLERIEALLALRDVHARHGHLQEVIVQNFLAKPGTAMARSAHADMDELLWTTAVARLVLGPAMNIQVPPNLSFDRFPELLDAGLNDWGGISPVTPDHVNPEAAWPQVEELTSQSAQRGFAVVERLTLYPAYVRDAARWIDAALVQRVTQSCDASGFPREDGWVCGAAGSVVPARSARRATPAAFDTILQDCLSGVPLQAAGIETLFTARGAAVDEVCDAADRLRARAHGNRVSYAVNRNINYTNICGYACTFCAFSKRGREHEGREKPYDLAMEEVARRASEAWARGASEVCMQGGIHPAYTGETYLALVRAVKQAVPRMHVHAFSPLEVAHGAKTLGLSLHEYLERLRDAGLGSLPGTAAEILDDEVRRVICHDKLTTGEWLQVMKAAHEVGLRTTATIMFGHIERPHSWAAHLLAIRGLQQRTGGFTEFVPLPFVHMEAPKALRETARPGPTWREVRLMHAIARVALHPHVPSIQASWTKNGPDGARELLQGGVNDLGGTLMNESISRAAGASHGQEMPPRAMEALIRTAGREPWQRNTLYGVADPVQSERSYQAAPLAPIILTPPARHARPAAPSIQEIS